MPRTGSFADMMSLQWTDLTDNGKCIGCGECDRCDLDPEKICDNCMKCVNGNAEYRGIAIDRIMLEKEDYPNP